MHTSSNTSPKAPAGFIYFGKINGIFGIHGKAKIFLYNRESDLCNSWYTFHLFDGKKILAEKQIKLVQSGKKVIGTIKGIQSPEALQEIMNLELLLREEDLPNLHDDEFYHHDLLGVEARTEDGAVLGILTEITPGTVSVFTIEGSEDTYYIPFISERVLKIVAKDHIVVSL